MAKSIRKSAKVQLEETVAFFPQGRRTLLKRILDKSRTFAAKAQELTEARLATTDRPTWHWPTSSGGLKLGLGV